MTLCAQLAIVVTDVEDSKKILALRDEDAQSVLDLIHDVWL